MFSAAAVAATVATHPAEVVWVSENS